VAGIDIFVEALVDLEVRKPGHADATDDQGGGEKGHRLVDDRAGDPPDSARQQRPSGVAWMR
jgi:hypothetical protein